MPLTGRSRRELVTAESRGLTRWTVRIADGTLGTLRENEFVDEWLSVVASVLADYQSQRVQLVGDVYGLRLPDGYEAAPR